MTDEPGEKNPKGRTPSQTKTLEVYHPADVAEAGRAARALAGKVGFQGHAGEEMAVVACELASNLLRHARGGLLVFRTFEDEAFTGLEMEAMDRGPGIPDPERAMTDGFSTVGGLGYGLGSVNRIMDDVEITPREGGGTRVRTRKRLRRSAPTDYPCPLQFGAATRAHPSATINGDAFLVKAWDRGALVGVIDGLGHGPFAHRASQTARRYLAYHWDHSLEAIFRGVGRACLSTRGVVMALGRFDFGSSPERTSTEGESIQLSFASVGNVEARTFRTPASLSFHVRRGVLGLNAPAAAVSVHPWKREWILVFHSDGLRSHWRLEDFPDLAETSAQGTAEALLCRLAKQDDDATVVVVKGA
jgi:anti-sigma regulatory factor (Ser/Thr protein kinase)